MKAKKENRRENAISFYAKLSHEEKKLLRKSFSFTLLEKKALTLKDLIEFDRIKESFLPLKKKYKLELDEILELVKEIFFPTTILNNKLTILEAVVKYLKDEKKFSFHVIGDILKRDERNIWHIYDNAKKKYAKRFSVEEGEYWIPLTIFAETKLSALEALVAHLKEEYVLSYHEIALIVKRDDRTVWTVYQRSRKKNAK
jgi:hypothetical protein